MNWNDYKNFSKAEFNCKHTGKNGMKPEFMELLQKLREEAGIPFIISSGFRDVTHPIEARKVAPGSHTKGVACDIQVMDGSTAGMLIFHALKLGFKGFGVAQDNRRNRTSRFIHLDIIDRGVDYPVFWSY